MKIEDLEMIIAINNADPIAFKKLFDNYWKKVYRRALEKLPLEEDASDITQEVFYVIWKNRGYWHVKNNIEGYLMAMLRHKIYDFYAHRDKLPIFVPLNEEEEVRNKNYDEARESLQTMIDRANLPTDIISNLADNQLLEATRQHK